MKETDITNGLHKRITSSDTNLIPCRLPTAEAASAFIGNAKIKNVKCI
ncbi:MAG: hypothetical protein KF829_10990 [Ferruginibacter sp.]|nr:hypothetical protein [Ferruginibacter sp.]